MFAEQVLIDHPDHVQIEIQGLEIDDGHAKLMRGGGRDIPGVGQLLVDQIGDQRDLLFAGLRAGGLQSGLFHNPVLDQTAGSPRRLRSVTVATIAALSKPVEPRATIKTRLYVPEITGRRHPLSGLIRL